MKHLSKQKRLRHYIILGGLVLALPLVVALLCIIVTGGVTDGLGAAAVPSVFLIHFVFGLIFLRDAGYEKMPLATLAGFIGLFLFWVIAFHMPGFMPLGLALLLGYALFIVASALLWEGIYRVTIWVHSLINKTNR